GCAEDRGTDRRGRGRASPRDKEEEEREHERCEEAADHPLDAAELRPHERTDAAAVAGEHERTQGPRHRVELVQRNDAPERDEREQPPAAEPERAEHDRRTDRHDQQARQEAAQRPPKRRRRLAYSATAARRSSGPKSGQSLSVKTSSEYASCQSRKF